MGVRKEGKRAEKGRKFRKNPENFTSLLKNPENRNLENKE
jgi:hypothetical protein